MDRPKLTITFDQIEIYDPNPHTIWKNLLVEYQSLGRTPDPDNISISDIARTSGVNAALQCSHALDWNNIYIRRLMIGIFVKWISRAFPSINSTDLLNDLIDLREWAEGDDKINLKYSSKWLQHEIVAMPTEKQRTSDEVMIFQVWMLIGVVIQQWDDIKEWINWDAAVATLVGSQLNHMAKDDEQEQFHQVRDIVSAFME
jgi:hypothetical protein